MEEIDDNSDHGNDDQAEGNESADGPNNFSFDDHAGDDLHNANRNDDFALPHAHPLVAASSRETDADESTDFYDMVQQFMAEYTASAKVHIFTDNFVLFTSEYLFLK